MTDFCRTIERSPSLFHQDLACCSADLSNIIQNSRFLVIGGAGSIGQAVVKQLLYRNPLALHVVDLSENNLAELVRDIRSTNTKHADAFDGFRTYALDINSVEFDCLMAANNNYDYVFNLAALKHVRSEKDPYTLMRMLRVNILHAKRLLQLSASMGVRKYFSVSSDKASNPVNIMGASKRIMEMILYKKRDIVPVSTARFANVAFSDGSLLHSFKMRIEKRQPIVAPTDIKRYFISDEEAGQLCVMAALLSDNSDIFFPKLDRKSKLVGLSKVACNYIQSQGYIPVMCGSEEEARNRVSEFSENGKWPCFFSKTDTTGEKPFEEFYDKKEIIDIDRFSAIGIIKNFPGFNSSCLEIFERKIDDCLQQKTWTKEQLVELVTDVVPQFDHVELGKSLDEKM